MAMKGFRKLASLYWAQVHFREARALCDLATSLPTEHQNVDVLFGLWNGVVVAYARSFTENKGISAMEAKFGRFDSRRYQALHDRLIEMRHHLHAHKDLLWEEHVAEKLGKPNSVSKIIVTVFNDGETEWEVQRPAFPEKYFNDVKQLCDLQATRLKKASDDML